MSEFGFRVLGPLQVDGPDGEIVVASGKQRALLAALLIDVGKVVSTDRLTDALWGDEPTPTATKSLQTYVARARRALRATGGDGPIVTRPPGYLLDVDADCVDRIRFEQLSSEGRQLLATDPDSAIVRLDHALGLWRGDAWAEFRTLPFALADAERLEEMRTSAREDRIDGVLALGRNDEAIASLEAFTAEHPYRERPHGQLMLALYREVRHADALAVFRRLRARLIDELGLEPSGALRELESAVLGQRDDLLAVTAPERASRVATTDDPGARAGVVPAPLSRAATHGTFAGRAHELDRVLDLAASTAEDGQPRLVLVEGEAGIGKSRFAAEAAARLAAQGLRVTFGRCDEEALVPYQALVESLRSLAVQVDDELAAEIAETIRLTDEPQQAAPPGVIADRAALLAGVESVFAAASPALLVVDDLQWADRPAVQALRHLLRSTRRLPVLVLATSRPEWRDPNSMPGWLLDSVDPTTVSRVSLGGLTVEQAQIVASEDFPTSVQHVDQAWSRTAGNPFLLREVLRHLDDHDAADAATVPPELRDVLLRRIAQLEPRLLDVLSAGALIGETFRLGHAARAVGAEPFELLDAMEAAALAGVVEASAAGDEHRFAHALVRDALTQRLSGGRRLHLHRRIAEVLEGDPVGHVAEVAHHRHAALPEGDVEAAVAAARTAADHATSRGAHEQAARMHRLAVEALVLANARDDDTDAQRLDAACALIRAGLLDEARTLLLTLAEAARRRGSAELLARAAILIGDTAPQWGVDDALTEVIEDALARLDPDSRAMRARLIARLAQAHYYSTESTHRRALAREAEIEARRSGDTEALAWVLSALHDALWGPDDVDVRVDTATKIAALGDALDHPELRLRGQGLLVADLMELGRLDGARAATDRHRRAAEEANQLLHRRDAEAWQATWALVDGRLDDARSAIDAALALSREAHDPNGDVLFWIQEFGVVTATGDRDELDRLASAYERLADEMPHVPAWRSALASVHVHRNDRAAAAAIVRDQVDERLTAIPRDVVWMNAVTYLAEAADFVQDVDAARALHRVLAPHAERLAIVDRALLCKGSVAHSIGLLERTLGDVDAAEHSFRTACEVHRRIGAVLLEQRSSAALDALR